MAQENNCPQCGAQMPPDAPEGLCPKCLMKAVRQDNTNVTLNGAVLIEGHGTKIGRYELLELIGEGGMGLVYLAEQKEPVKRRLALKIIKPGMDSAQVIARFEAERQALAMLDHHNIAHVFDAGTTETGRPYFVMEYVKGMSITRYCDEHKLNVEQRLRLFREVCEGVHHAHQKGIIHRDIKPSNILISIHEDRAVPKIIDFGIAKAAASTLTEKTMFTFHGQLLGTPEYMSPEQVDLETQDIDTRSDIYSLGVVLYELLAGVLPFEKESLQKIGLAELQHTLREVEPAPPSIRLSNLGEKAKAIAGKRMTQVVPLARRLHRELEWIPLKAMRKDRCRRYKSASDMADDVQNYLNGNPLLAGPETAMYRVQKFVRKHAGSVTTAALVSVAVIIGLMASLAMASRAEKARQQETAARVEAEQARDKEAALRAQLEQALVRAEKAEKEAQERTEAYRRAMYANNLSMAKEAFDAGYPGRARKLLESCDPDLRGWEWEHLNYMSVDPCIRTCRDFEGDVWSIAVSPNGKHIITGSGSGGKSIALASEVDTIKIWDAVTGSQVMAMRAHNGTAPSIAVSPDGTRIASGGGQGVIKIWDTASGAEVKTLPGHKGGIGSVAFSPDGKHIASGGKDRIIKVWEVKSGAGVMTLRGHKSTIGEVAYSPDGKLIVSGSSDCTIKMWDAETGAEIRTLTGHGDNIESIAVSPDGSCIASASRDKTVKVWDTATGSEVMTLHGHSGRVYSVVFSPDGKRIASGGGDETIRIWNVNTGREERRLTGHTAEVCEVVFSRDGKQIISGGYDNTMRVWDPAIHREVLQRYGGTGITEVAFSPDGKRIAAATPRGGLPVLIDALSGEITLTLRGLASYIRRPSFVAFSPDGSRIVSCGDYKVVEVSNALTGAREMTLKGHTEGVCSAAFSPNGKHIVSGSKDETVKVWNAATGDLERTLTGHKHRVNSVTFSPDGRHIISGSRDGTIRIWEAFSGTELLIIHGHEGGVGKVSVSSDGKRIAAKAGDNTLKIWDATTGEELMTLHAPETDDFGAGAFSPDGRRIVSNHSNGFIKIWDADTGLELIDLCVEASDNIFSVAFSPNGKSVCVGLRRGGIVLLESVEPASGNETRRIANAASRLVDALYEEHELSEDVISRLRDDDTIVEAVRSKALQIANARLEEDIWTLKHEIRQVVLSTYSSDVEYREALEKLERVVSYDSSRPWHFVFLGAAQYRVGAYEDALATLTRAEKIRKKIQDDRGVEPGLAIYYGSGPTTDAFSAMALHQLGRDKEANAILQHLRSGFERWFSAKDPLFRPPFRILGPSLELIIEVERLFARGDNTLLSIWELIEEEKLDEASELIEKARQSKNADYVNRMEGAIKLIEVLRKRQ